MGTEIDRNHLNSIQPYRTFFQVPRIIKNVCEILIITRVGPEIFITCEDEFLEFPAKIF